MTLGEVIAEMREERKMTQDELGRSSGLGAWHISRIEADEVSPSLGALHRIARALGKKFLTQFVDADEKQEDAAEVGRALRQFPW